MQLFVLGMHRSGTSAVTRLLNMAGAYFGPEGISNGADEGNPKGFWERRDIRAVCDGLLRESGCDWWRASGFGVENIPEEARHRHLGTLRKLLLEIDAHRPWVVKEPRLCLLFPLVRPLAWLAYEGVIAPLHAEATSNRQRAFPGAVRAAQRRAPPRGPPPRGAPPSTTCSEESPAHGRLSASRSAFRPSYPPRSTTV